MTNVNLLAEGIYLGDKSSLITWAANKDGRIYVQLKKEGRVYSYYDPRGDHFKALQTEKSPGKYFNSSLWDVVGGSTQFEGFYDIATPDSSTKFKDAVAKAFKGLKSASDVRQDAGLATNVAAETKPLLPSVLSFDEEYTKPESSVVDWLGYSKIDAILYVQFKADKWGNDKVKAYLDVPYQIWTALGSSYSAGKFLNAEVFHKFEAVDVSGQDILDKDVSQATPLKVAPPVWNGKADSLVVFTIEGVEYQFKSNAYDSSTAIDEVGQIATMIDKALTIKKVEIIYG